MCYHTGFEIRCFVTPFFPRRCYFYMASDFELNFFFIAAIAAVSSFFSLYLFNRLLVSLFAHVHICVGGFYFLLPKQLDNFHQTMLEFIQQQQHQQNEFKKKRIYAMNSKEVYDKQCQHNDKLAHKSLQVMDLLEYVICLRTKFFIQFSKQAKQEKKNNKPVYFFSLGC